MSPSVAVCIVGRAERADSMARGTRPTPLLPFEHVGRAERAIPRLARGTRFGTVILDTNPGAIPRLARGTRPTPLLIFLERNPPCHPALRCAS